MTNAEIIQEIIQEINEAELVSERMYAETTVAIAMLEGRFEALIEAISEK